jgi:hypothetical protein
MAKGKNIAEPTMPSGGHHWQFLRQLISSESL